MADKKLTDLPLETASAETDEIYAVRNGVSDVRLRLKDVIPDNVSAPKIVSPANGASNVPFKPELVASAYAPLYDNIDRDYRQFQLTLSGDVDFLSPVIDENVSADSYLMNVGLDSSVEYSWRCRDVSLDGDVSKWSVVSVFETRAGEVVKPVIVSPENGTIDFNSRTVVSSAFSITGGSDSQAGSIWELYNADDQLIHASGFVTAKSSYKFNDIEIETTYKVRVKHVGVNYGESEWSDFVEFTTGSEFPVYQSIGVPGEIGFGVGVYNDGFESVSLSDLGLSPMDGYDDPSHDNYGNYIHENSSQMVFIPKFYYRIGNANHPKYDIFGANSLEIVGTETYETETEANADGFILHRAFIDGGQEKTGFFIDKYHLSKKSDDPDVAVSVRYGVPISLTNNANYTNSNGMPNCTGILADSLELCKARGSQYNQCSAFALSALAMLSLAHGQYATSADACAWFDPTYTTNFPKGCNNNALGDVNDPTLTFISAGDSGNANKPQCGSANNLAKTTHNGQNSGVADLNGAMWDLGLGITNFGTSATSTTHITNATLYVLKESVALASLTSGWNNPTDAWQSSDNIGTLYDQFTSQISLGTSGAVYWGNGTNPVFPTDSSGNNRAICGILGVNDSSFSASGTNMFGNDYFYKYNRHNMFVRFGGYWNSAANAGVFCRNLSLYRCNAYNYASSRGLAYGA